MADQMTVEEWWTSLLTGQGLKVPLRQLRHALRFLPSEERCIFCNSPFDGFAASAMRMIGRGPSRLSHKFCKLCQVVCNKNIGGAETDVSLLFADVRGSTSLAEGMSSVEFSKLISRFFGVSSKVLLKSGAWVDRLVGDQVIGMYFPYYVGSGHQRAAVQAAKSLLRATGHGSPEGPWIPLGVGIHSGTSFVGLVGSADAATDVTVLGDAPNVAARLSSAAAPGEILISDETFAVTGLSDDLEYRSLELKGKSVPMGVRVITDLAS